jgi:hypothetical protein
VDRGEEGPWKEGAEMRCFGIVTWMSCAGLEGQDGSLFKGRTAPFKDMVSEQFVIYFVLHVMNCALSLDPAS